MSIWQKILAFLTSLVSLVKPVPVQPPSPTPTPTPPPPTLSQKLVALITAANYDDGPFAGTGGQVFKNTADQTLALANALIASVNTAAGVTLSLLASLIYGESMFSLKAIDPNLNVPVTPPNTRQDYTDYGPAQINYSTFAQYPALAGLAPLVAIAKVEDPSFAIPLAASIMADAISWANEQDAFWRSTSRAMPPYKTPIVLAMDSYNRGKSGSAFAAICQSLNQFAVDVDANIVQLTSDIDQSTVSHTMTLAMNAYLERNPGGTAPNTWDATVAYFSSQPADPFTYGNGVVSRAALYQVQLGE